MKADRCRNVPSITWQFSSLSSEQARPLLLESHNDLYGQLNFKRPLFLRFRTKDCRQHRLNFHGLLERRVRIQLTNTSLDLKEVLLWTDFWNIIMHDLDVRPMSAESCQIFNAFPWTGRNKIWRLWHRCSVVEVSRTFRRTLFALF
jgi:hypothetical protein